MLCCGQYYRKASTGELMQIMTSYDKSISSCLIEEDPLKRIWFITKAHTIYEDGTSDPPSPWVITKVYDATHKTVVEADGGYWLFDGVDSVVSVLDDEDEYKRLFGRLMFREVTVDEDHDYVYVKGWEKLPEEPISITEYIDYDTSQYPLNFVIEMPHFNYDVEEGKWTKRSRFVCCDEEMERVMAKYGAMLNSKLRSVSGICYGLSVDQRTLEMNDLTFSCTAKGYGDRSTVYKIDVVSTNPLTGHLIGVNGVSGAAYDSGHMRKVTIGSPHILFDDVDGFLYKIPLKSPHATVEVGPDSEYCLGLLMESCSYQGHCGGADFGARLLVEKHNGNYVIYDTIDLDKPIEDVLYKRKPRKSANY
jgi:hypothetical protein